MVVFTVLRLISQQVGRRRWFRQTRIGKRKQVSYQAEACAKRDLLPINPSPHPTY